MNHMNFMHHSEWFIKLFRFESLFCNLFTLFHCELNAFWKYQKLKSSVSSNYRTYVKLRAQFDKKELFDCFDNILGWLCVQTFDSKIAIIELSCVYFAKWAAIKVPSSMDVLSFDVKRSKNYLKIIPLNIINDDLSVDALLLNNYFKLFK